MMSFLDAVRSILGIKPVKVGDLDAEVALSSPAWRATSRLSTSALDNGIGDIEVIPEYLQVRSLIDAKVPLLFVTGGAGTGKSTLIRYLRHSLPMHTAIVAPTGIAALNAGGVTIHSLFRFPPKIIQKKDVQRVYDRQLYNKLELLIVDEVSMVRPDLLDGIDLFLKLNRDDKTPFGGVQVLLIGDLFQLPPVVQRDEQLFLRKVGYATDFFFSASGISDSPLVPIVLQRIFRQTDPEFVSLLNNLRDGKRVTEALQTVNTKCIGSVEGVDHELILTCTNHDADERNRVALQRLPSPPRTYVGSAIGKFQIENTRLPSPLNLDLKEGAQVMFTKNDSNKRWVNGTIGRIVELDEKFVRVEIQGEHSDEALTVNPETWQKCKYEFDVTEDRIVAQVIGSYTQLPLMLAWAVTIHKAQGKTLSKIFIDLGNRAFAPGQVYVALSRVRSLRDLRLARAIREEEVRCNPDIKKFYKQLRQLTRLTDGEQPPTLCD